LLEPLMTKGKRKTSRPPLAQSRARFQSDLAVVPESARELRSPTPPQVRSTDALRRLTAETRRRLRAELRSL
jgi:nicotinate phosphoribosyltransferase